MMTSFNGQYKLLAKRQILIHYIVHPTCELIFLKLNLNQILSIQHVNECLHYKPNHSYFYKIYCPLIITSNITILLYVFMHLKLYDILLILITC